MLKSRCIPVHTRGATPFVFLYFNLIEIPHIGVAHTYHVVARVERPLFAGYCAAWEPPTCAYLSLLNGNVLAIGCTYTVKKAFFGQPLPKAF